MNQLPGDILFIVAIVDRILQQTEKLGFPFNVVLPPSSYCQALVLHIKPTIGVDRDVLTMYKSEKRKSKMLRRHLD